MGQARRESPEQARIAGPDPGAEVFLSPRVIDQTAFEAYASRLRGMIDELRAEASAARAAAEANAASAAALRELDRKTKSQAELAAKLLRAVNQRAEQLDAATAKAADHARVAQLFEAEAERIVAECAGRFRARLDAAIDEKSADLQRRAGASSASLLARLTELESACARAERVLGDASSGAGLTGAAARVERALEHASGAESRLDAARERAERAVNGLAAALDSSVALAEQTAARQSALDQSLREAIRACAATEHGLMERLNEARAMHQGAEAFVERLRGATAEARRAIDRAEGLAGRAAAAASSMHAAAREMDDAAARLEPWRRVLIDEAECDDLPAPLARLIDQVRHELGQDLAKMASAMSLIARGAQTSVRAGRGGRSTAAGEAPEVVIKLDSGSEVKRSA